MISKDNYLAENLYKHLGHNVEIVTYGTDDVIHDVCLECIDCGEVIISAEDYEEVFAEERDYDDSNMPELGNLLFGNSRGEYPITERGHWQDLFIKYFVDTGYFDGYGFYLNDNQEHKTDRGGYESNVFILNPYYWGEDDGIAELPNFVYKPNGLEIQWYKYPFRDSYTNHTISLERAEKIFARCLEDLQNQEVKDE